MGRSVADLTRVGVGVIASGGPDEAITAVLSNEGFTYTSFDSARALTRGQLGEEPSSIVMWVEQAISSLPELIEPLTGRFESSPVVVVCPSIQRWEVRAALTSGAAGVVLFEDLASKLSSCLHAVEAGQICVPRRHWRVIEPPALSTREKQILGLVVMGYMNSQIAEQLFLAESTVKSHLSSAFGKLGVRSRNEAVDLILNPQRGLGMGILALGGEPIETTLSEVEPTPAAAR